MIAASIETKVFDGSDAATRLRELGLDLAMLREVVLQGEQARAEATHHDPINAAAWDAYRYRVRAFRDHAVPRGWTADYAGGLEKTWSPDEKHVVITRAGDEGVGLGSAFPQPKQKPGAEIRGIVESATLPLDPNWLNARPTKLAPSHTTWILLVYNRADLVRAELSSPIGLTDEDNVLGWYERILLPDLDFGNGPRSGTSESTEAADEIDVPVARKR